MVAQAFKDGIKFSPNDISLDLKNNFKLTLKGSLDSQSLLSNFIPFKIQAPEWTIEYIEKEKIFLNIRTNGSIFSSIYGLIPFSENYKTEKEKIVIDEKLRNIILEFSTNGSLPSRDQIFQKIFMDKIFSVLAIKNNVAKIEFEDFFKKKYIDFIKATILELGNGFAKNRLLKKVPNQNFGNLVPEGLSLDTSKVDDLINLNLINFSPEPSKEQRDCRNRSSFVGY